MYRDWPREKFLQTLGLKADQVPEVLILLGAWSIPEAVAAAKPWFEDITATNALWNGFVGRYGPRQVGFAAVFGAPMAASVVHAFGVSGTAVFFQVGSCGGLRSDMNIGDLIVPDFACKGESTAYSYLPQGRSVPADAHLTCALRDGCIPYGLPIHRGTVHTTTTLFAETESDLRTWQQHGCCAVDMETAATFAVATALGKRCAALLYVVDCPAEGRDLISITEEETKREERAEIILLQLPLALLDSLS